MNAEAIVPFDSERQPFPASSWQGKAIPERPWLIENWAPIGTTTALYGDGGTGKSLLAQQLMTCAAVGIKFLGMPTARVATLGIFCEDDAHELHRRQSAINAHYHIDCEALGDMHVLSCVGMENALVEYESKKRKPTKFFFYLRQLALDLQVKLIVIDTAADTFSGNENDRQDVRYYVQLLNGLAQAISGAVLLCAHPSIHGITSGTGSGGSTAWSNSVRSRIYLTRPDVKSGAALYGSDVKNMREFSKMKSNYSTIGETMILKWTAGVFALEQGPAIDSISQVHRTMRDRDDEEVFLSNLDRLTIQGRVISDSKNASTYAPKIMARINKENNIGILRFTEAMERLFSADVIDVGSTGIKGPDRKNKQGIRRRSADCSGVPHG